MVGMGMDSVSTRAKIVIFIMAIAFTAGLAYAAVKAMQWAFAYVASFAQGGEHPMLRIVGGIVIAIIVALRFYFRRRAKAALANKGR